MQRELRSHLSAGALAGSASFEEGLRCVGRMRHHWASRGVSFAVIFMPLMSFTDSGELAAVAATLGIATRAAGCARSAAAGCASVTSVRRSAAIAGNRSVAVDRGRIDDQVPAVREDTATGDRST